jgi:hypothetical protein
VDVGIIPEKVGVNGFILDCFIFKPFKKGGGTGSAAGMDKELHIHIIILTKSLAGTQQRIIHDSYIYSNLAIFMGKNLKIPQK